MTDRVECLLADLAPLIGVRLPDAPAAVARMELGEVRNLLDGAGVGDRWPMLLLAYTLDEVRLAARHQAEVDWSAGGRRHRIAGL